MWLRLRQVAFVARALEPVVEDLRVVLGIEVCHHDPAVGKYGLHNALLPVGNQFIEVVAPTEEGTAGGRYLDRRGGDGGYMVILQTGDHPPRRQHVKDLGIRLVGDTQHETYDGMQLHPRDTGGTFLEIDAQLGPGALDRDGPWDPAGPRWKAAQRLDRVDGITAAEIQADDPAALAARWAQILQLPVAADAGGRLALALDGASLRFAPATDGRPEGLGGIDVRALDRGRVLAAARERGSRVEGDTVLLGGVRVNLV